MNPAMLALLAARATYIPTDAYSQAVLAESNVLCYYPLDDPVGTVLPRDTTGRTVPTVSNGTVFGAASLGVGTTSVQFDGAAVAYDRGIQITGFPEQYSEITVEAVVSADDFVSTRAIISADSDSWLKSGFLIRHTATAYSTATLQSYLSIDDVWPKNLVVATDFVHTTRYHIAITWDSTTGLARVWVNGSYLSVIRAGVSITNATTITIGGRRGGDFNFLGRIAGFAVHPKALPDARIIAHAEAAGVI